MATYQDLVAQRSALEKQQAELEKQIAETLKAERDGVIAQIRALMAEHGITVAELSAAKPGRPPRAARSADGEAAPARKVAPKFRDPATGDTWSGRGLKPKWLTAALESGRTLEEFAIAS